MPVFAAENLLEDAAIFIFVMVTTGREETELQGHPQLRPPCWTR